MAESSALFCFSPFPSLNSLSRSSPRDVPSSSSHLYSFTHSSRRISPLIHSRTAQSLRTFCGSRDPDSDGSNEFGEESTFGFYPWDSRASFAEDAHGLQWLPEDKVTLFTADGLVQLGGSLVPRRIPLSQQGKSKPSPQRLQRFQERDYMDPHQELCLGALFNIAATNGLDTGRRLCIFGFCRSIEMLNDVVEDTVLEHGGEVVAAEKASVGGLHEKLSMIVAVPLLWGVPPASDSLHVAVRSGGGIIDKLGWRSDKQVF